MKEEPDRDGNLPGDSFRASAAMSMGQNKTENLAALVDRVLLERDQARAELGKAQAEYLLKAQQYGVRIATLEEERKSLMDTVNALIAELNDLRNEKSATPYAKRCDRFSAALEQIMEICQTDRSPDQSQIFEIAEEALIEEESAS